MVFFWLESVALARERVKDRLTKGGHNIPEEVIERRYYRGLKNFLEFMSVVDQWALVDNSKTKAVIVAKGNQNTPIVVYNNDIWKNVQNL